MEKELSVHKATGEYCRRWLHANGLSPKTIASYSFDLKQFGAFVGTQTTVTEITIQCIEQWIVALQTQGYCASSIRRKIASVRGYFTYYKNRGVIQRSPCEGLRLRLQETRRLTPVIADEDLQTIMEYAQERVKKSEKASFGKRMLALRDRAIIRLLIATGMRVGELVAICQSRLSLTAGEIRIIGKGNKERLAFLVDEQDYTQIAEYMVLRIGMQLSHDNVFVNHRGNALTTEGVRRIIKTIAADCNIQSRITPHMFRHTAATRFLENGADLRVVQVFLGHASIRSTERYTHVSSSHLRAVIGRCHPLRRNAA